MPNFAKLTKKIDLSEPTGKPGVSTTGGHCCRHCYKGLHRYINLPADCSPLRYTLLPLPYIKYYVSFSLFHQLAQQQRHKTHNHNANEFDDEYLLGLKNFARDAVELDWICRIIPPMPEIGGGNSDPHSNYTSSSSAVESWWSLIYIMTSCYTR